MNDLSLLILRKEIKDDNSIFLTEEHRNFKTTNDKEYVNTKICSIMRRASEALNSNR